MDRLSVHVFFESLVGRLKSLCWIFIGIFAAAALSVCIWLGLRIFDYLRDAYPSRRVWWVGLALALFLAFIDFCVSWGEGRARYKYESADDIEGLVLGPMLSSLVIGLVVGIGVAIFAATSFGAFFKIAGLVVISAPLLAVPAAVLGYFTGYAFISLFPGPNRRTIYR